MVISVRQIAGIWLSLAVLTSASLAGTAREKKTLRWIEGQPGCTFSADDDGRYRYGLWTDDFGIVLAIDSQELHKAGRRTEPIFTALLTLRYRGKGTVSINPAGLTLEFVKHSHDVHSSLDPGELAARFRIDSDRFAQATAHDIAKRPGRKSELESRLAEHQKNIDEMLRFLDSRSLRSLELSAVHPDSDGWVYFSASSKWIGDWKKQEEFVLRIPLADQVIEFPFALPPSEGDLLLRRR